MRIKSKFWLEDDRGKVVFGEGRRRMLELIGRLGSMQAAAKALNMSYRGVWARIKATEDRLGYKLVETSVGRGKDRGSRLTPEAEKLLENFNLMNEKGLAYSNQLFGSIFEGREREIKPVAPVLALVGPAGVGKTDLIGRLIAEWTSRGKRIGVIHLHDEETQAAGRDQGPLQAGARVVISFHPDRLVLDLPDLSALTPEIVAVNYALGADLVLVESRRRLHLPSVEVFRQDLQKAPLTRMSKHLAAVVGDRPQDKPDWPHFEFDQVPALVDHLEKNVLGETQDQEKIKLVVDGRRVPMLPFVKEIIKNAVVGMVRSLKSCENAGDIDLSIRR